MEHVNGWCFRGIYKVGLWEDDLHVSARLQYATSTTIGPVTRQFTAIHQFIGLLEYKFYFLTDR